MCHDKWEKITEGIELSNQERIRTLGEKETYKYLGILEADTIKQVDMKDKPENCLKPSSAAEVSSKG